MTPLHHSKGALRLVITLLLGWMAPACAQDQVEVLDETFQELDSTTAALIRVNATISPGDARSLIGRTLLASGNPDLINDPNFYCILHIVRWKDGKDITIDKHRWFTFRGGTASPSQKDFEGTRIYGKHDVAVLYVHTNVPKVEADRATLARMAALYLKSNDEDWSKAENRNSTLDGFATPLPTITRSAITAAVTDPTQLAVIKQQLADAKALDDCQSGQLGSFTDTHGRRFQLLGSANYVRDYLDVTYRVEITKKLPAPVQSLASLLFRGQAGLREPQMLDTKPGALWSGRILRIDAVPSDVTVRALLNKADSSTEIAKQTFDNEGLYYWDISVALPLRATKQLEFNPDDQTAAPKVVEKQNVYALMNIFFTPIDAKNVQPQWIPHPVMGVGITGKPLDRTMVGLALGINKVQGFAGVAFNRVRKPESSATPPKLGFDYDKKFIFGVNLPVRQVLELWKKK